MSQQKQTAMTLPSSSKSLSSYSGQVWSSTTLTRSKETTLATSQENLSESKTKSMTTTSTEQTTREDETTIHRLQSPSTNSTTLERSTTLDSASSQHTTFFSSQANLSPSQTYIMTTTSTDLTTTEDMTTICQLQSPSTNLTDDLFTDCSNIGNGFYQSGSYGIFPYGMSNSSVSVYCECTLDGMWTVIQKRFDGSEDFYRNWTDYKDGFGDVSGEYWLGNDVIHQLTSHANYTLRVVLTDWDNITKYAIYSIFTVADEADGYRISIGGYSGDAGDAITQQGNGQMFSTRDRDNDGLGSGSCAVSYSGSWWYNGCSSSNLNGPHHPMSSTYVAKSMWWNTMHSRPLKATTMMIKQN